MSIEPFKNYIDSQVFPIAETREYSSTLYIFPLKSIMASLWRPVTEYKLNELRRGGVGDQVRIFLSISWKRNCHIKLS